MKKDLIIIATFAFIHFSTFAGGDKSKLINTQWKLSQLSINGSIQTLPTQPDSIASLSFVSGNQLTIKAGKQINNYTWDLNTAGNKVLLNNTPESSDASVVIDGTTITLTFVAQNAGDPMTIVQKFTKEP